MKLKNVLILAVCFCLFPLLQGGNAVQATDTDLADALAKYTYEDSANLLDIDGQPLRLVSNGDGLDLSTVTYENGVLSFGDPNDFCGSLRLTNDLIESGKLQLKNGETENFTDIPLLYQARIRFLENNGFTWVGGGFSFGVTENRYTANLRIQANHAYNMIMKTKTENYSVAENMFSGYGSQPGSTRNLSVVKDGSRYIFFVDDKLLGESTVGEYSSGHSNILSSVHFGFMSNHCRMEISNMRLVPLVQAQLPSPDVSGNLVIAKDISFTMSGTGKKTVENPYLNKGLYVLAENSLYRYVQQNENRFGTLIQFDLKRFNNETEANVRIDVRKNETHKLSVMISDRRISIFNENGELAGKDFELQSETSVRILSETNKLKVTAGDTGVSCSYIAESPMDNVIEITWTKFTGEISNLNNHYTASVYAESPEEKYPEFSGKGEANTQNIPYEAGYRQKIGFLYAGIILAVVGLVGTGFVLFKKSEV